MFKRFFAFVISMIMTISCTMISVYADDSDLAAISAAEAAETKIKAASSDDYTGKLVYKTVSDKSEYTSDDETIHVDFKLDESYMDSDYKGLSNTTFYVTYNPDVVIANSATKGDVVYTSGNGDVTAFISPSLVNTQIAIKPSATNADFSGLGANGQKTAAELGKIKIVAAPLVSQTPAVVVTGGETFFGIDFNIVGEGDANIQMVGFDNSGIRAYGRPTDLDEDDNQILYPVAFVGQTITVVESTTKEGYDFIASAAATANEVLYDGKKASVTAYQILKLNAANNTVGENSYTYNLQPSATNTTTLTIDGEKEIFRIALKITARKDTKIKIDHKVGASKTNYILKGDIANDAVEVVDSKSNSTDSSIYDTFTFSLKAGETAYFAGVGTNPVVYAVDGLGDVIDYNTKVALILKDVAGIRDLTSDEKDSFGITDDASLLDAVKILKTINN